MSEHNLREIIEVFNLSCLYFENFIYLCTGNKLCYYDYRGNYQI